MAIFIIAPLLIGVNSSRKEFAPIGANSFLEELTHFGMVSLPKD